MIQRHYLDGKEATPNNYRELSININYDPNSNDENFQQVKINEWEFGLGDLNNPEDFYNIIIAHKNNGLTGGVGVTEGIPFKIDLDSEMGTIRTLFDGFIDAWGASYDEFNNKIYANAVEQGKLDWLEFTADSVSFERLWDEGKITNSMRVTVPYIINKKQNNGEIFLNTVTLFVVVNELKKQITEIQQLQVGAANPLEATTIIRLVLQILYCIALLISIVNILVELFNSLVQPVKYHYGMYAKDLIRIGLAELGLGFSSSILEKHPYDKLVIIPEKFNIKENNTGIFKNIFGNLKVENEKTGFYKGTLGKLLRELKIEMFYAKFIIDSNSILHIEKQNFTLAKPILQLPNIEKQRYTLNQSDFKSNILLTFQTDLNDRNTIQEYSGTSVQIITLPKAVINKKMSLIKEASYINIPFALAKRKTELNFIEKILDSFFKDLVAAAKVLLQAANLAINAANTAISIINKMIKKLKAIGINVNFQIPSVPKLTMPNFINQIDGTRINMMKMETDYIYVPKMVLIEKKTNPRQNVIHADNELYLNARYIWETFHCYKSFVPNQDGVHGQYMLSGFNGIPFTFDDYEKVRTSNQILDAEGNSGQSLTFDIIPTKEVATGTYRINKLYTKNLAQKIIVPDGK